jgi:hypothetical protein
MGLGVYDNIGNVLRQGGDIWATLKRKRNHFAQQADEHFVLRVCLPKNRGPLDIA